MFLSYCSRVIDVERMARIVLTSTYLIFNNDKHCGTSRQRQILCAVGRYSTSDKSEDFTNAILWLKEITK